MKKAYPALGIVLIAVAFLGWQFLSKNRLVSPAGIQPFSSPTPKPFLKYTIENLSKTNVQPSQIKIGEIIKDDPVFASRYFFFNVDGKKVSGLINLPKTPGSHPVIIMFRGYVDHGIYATGVGTQRAGEVFAQNGFITFAPDFLGYGKSDLEAQNSIESRFQTYTTAITLLNSIKTVNGELLTVNSEIKADASRVGIWGHSNGGQIALTVLEATGKPYPTVLWAPVSKPFPYSILYYTDTYDDHGKALRKVIANFEKEYDTEKYSLTNYFQKISAPIQLHQGSTDDAVPQSWSDNLVETLKKLDKNIDYFVYPGAEHNLLGGWQQAVERSIAFYQDNLKVRP